MLLPRTGRVGGGGRLRSRCTRCARGALSPIQKKSKKNDPLSHPSLQFFSLCAEWAPGNLQPLTSTRSPRRLGRLRTDHAHRSQLTSAQPRIASDPTAVRCEQKEEIERMRAAMHRRFDYFLEVRVLHSLKTGLTIFTTSIKAHQIALTSGEINGSFSRAPQSSVFPKSDGTKTTARP